MLTRAVLQFITAAAVYLYCASLKPAARFLGSSKVASITGYKNKGCYHTALFGSDYFDSTFDQATESLKGFLNSEESKQLSMLLTMSQPQLKNEMEKANFWFGSSMTVKATNCVRITESDIEFDALCNVKGKMQNRTVSIAFPIPVLKDDPDTLKKSMIELAINVKRLCDTKSIVKLPFGHNYELPLDFRFNDVPHAQWLRAYLYESVTKAVVAAVNDKSFPKRRKMQVKINFPEVNPAFDTYRIGTILESVRDVALTLACDEGKRVRVCVQQSLGEGVFAGMPLALASMRPVMERMDWGQRLSAEQKAQPGDYTPTSLNAPTPMYTSKTDGSKKRTSRAEALIRFGSVGADQVADDDDVIIIIAPQNLIGGSIMGFLEEMVEAADGKPIILFNPLLKDRPSSGGVMSIRGRAERTEFAESFVDIFELRLLYPSSGGYMYPIRGLALKKDHRSNWVIYSKGEDASGKEKYEVVAAFPPEPTPDRTVISDVFAL